MCVCSIWWGGSGVLAPQNGAIQCEWKCNLMQKVANFRLTLKLRRYCRSFKMRVKRTKICNLFVEFFAKVKKKLVWTNEGRSLSGCKIGVKSGME